MEMHSTLNTREILWCWDKFCVWIQVVGTQMHVLGNDAELYKHTVTMAMSWLTLKVGPSVSVGFRFQDHLPATHPGYQNPRMLKSL